MGLPLVFQKTTGPTESKINKRTWIEDVYIKIENIIYNFIILHQTITD